MWSFLKEEILKKSIYLRETTRIWSIEDSEEIITEILSNDIVLLGGDVIDNQFKHTHDSWYYNYNNAKSPKENCKIAATVAKEYIFNYMQRNGNEFYIEFVILKTKDTYGIFENNDYGIRINIHRYAIEQYDYGEITSKDNSKTKIVFLTFRNTFCICEYQSDGSYLIDGTEILFKGTFTTKGDSITLDLNDGTQIVLNKVAELPDCN